MTCSDRQASEPAVTNATYLLSGSGSALPWAGNYSRGLWAQCGAQCQWFWEAGFTLQVNLFTPLSQFALYSMIIISLSLFA